jgi:hypothetical protein
VQENPVKFMADQEQLKIFEYFLYLGCMINGTRRALKLNPGLP